MSVSPALKRHLASVNYSCFVEVESCEKEKPEAIIKNHEQVLEEKQGGGGRGGRGVRAGGRIGECVPGTTFQ